MSTPAALSGSTLYADWVRGAEPGAVAHAERVVAEIADGLRRGWEKPARYVGDIAASARGLPAGHLPWFWDTVAHRLAANADGSRLGGRYRKAAGTAYSLARHAEREHNLPIDADFRVRNALLMARHGAIPVKELVPQQKWLAQVFPPGDAHTEFVRLLEAWSAGGGPLGADWHRRVRASAKAAGLPVTEDARVLAAVLGVGRGGEVPDGLLDGAAAVFAKAKPASSAGLLSLFPETNTDGGALLRMLDAAGAVDAMADAGSTPDLDPAEWLGRFYHLYCYRKVPYGGVIEQPMPAELFDAVRRWAPRLRASGTPVRLRESRFTHGHVDADLADALLAEGVPLDTGRSKLSYRGGSSRRDLHALAAHPEYGPQLEHLIHAHRGTHGSAIGKLPDNPGIEASVHARVLAVLERVRDGGLLDAEHAIEELDGLLDAPTVRALDGIDGALAALDGTGPLLRTLRAGIPAEFQWPALEEALAEVGEVVGATATWPALTVFGVDRAVTVGAEKVLARTEFRLPPEAEWHLVLSVGGDFLVAYATGGWRHSAPHAFWASAPGEVFEPDEDNGLICRGSGGGALGYQFAAGDGRHDGDHVLRPGDQHGVGRYDMQLSDGVRLWSAQYSVGGRNEWSEVDPVTGERADTFSLPEFFAPDDVPEGRQLAWTQLSYAPLPDGVDSPLGVANGLTGFRVTRDRASEREYVLEGVDGRTATFTSGARRDLPWGVVRMPGGDTDVVVTHDIVDVFAPMRAHVDDSPLWEVRSFPDPREYREPDPLGRAMMPPPAFWHFLRPRDPAGSLALRRFDSAAASALISDGVVPPEVTDPVLADAVRACGARAAAVLRHREQLSARVSTMRVEARSDRG